MTHYVVIGGSGFIGSRLSQLLGERGHRVRIFDTLAPRLAQGLCEYMPGDVREPGAVSAAMADAEVVFHCAAQQPVAQKNSRVAARLMQQVNVEGTHNVLSAAQAAGLKKVVFVSSMAIYGARSENPITENTQPLPIEEYGRTKVLAEQLCREFAAAGLDVTIVRPPPVIGEGRLGVFQILFDWISKGYNIPVFGHGDQRQQWIHLDDCLDGCVRAAARPGAGAYNIGAPAEQTLRQLLEQLIRHSGSSSRVRSFPKRLSEIGIVCGSWLGVLPIAPFHALTYGASIFADITRAGRELGWQARHSQYAMFQEAYDWYIANRSEILGRRTGSQHQLAPNPRLMQLGRLIP